MHRLFTLSFRFKIAPTVTINFIVYTKLLNANFVWYLFAQGYRTPRPSNS